MHGLLPRLGFFAENEDRIPYDYHEILASVAPRPMLVIAPSWDQYHAYEDVKKTVLEAKKVYGLYHSEDKLQLEGPEDYNRLSPDTKALMLKWAKENFVEESLKP
ncbi:hypothetical protein OKW21_004171 [Catalinimonas alkaloidigena]|uniref:glucuronyl esterase domain-containing protein n=1 Tax=Catalinimonas alkaloidigena TaxID=1075417 RepID=UPI002404BB1E|nr:hypothetical protein [Catalinimonas alkaloidigena]MDF9798908.1 hypothetical protein [Catalinimonas alkaloidigena]